MDLQQHWDEEGVRDRSLARLLIWIRRKWKRRDGSLVPLEAIQTVTDQAKAEELARLAAAPEWSPGSLDLEDR